MFGLFQTPRRSATPPPGPPTSGLKLWLDAAKGVTASASIVSAWADQSGNGNDATVPGGYVGPTLDAGVINGLPGMNTFYLPNVALGGSGTPLSNGSPYHVISVVKMSDAPSQPGGFSYGGGLIDIGAGIGSVFGNYGGDIYISGSVIATGVPAVANTPYMFELASDTATQTAAIDGTNLTLASTVPMGAGGAAGWTLGDFAGGNGPFWGWFCEILIYDHVLTGADLAAARTYVNTKYAL